MKLFKSVHIVQSQVCRRRRDGSSVSLEPSLLSDLLGAYGGNAVDAVVCNVIPRSSMMLVPGGLA